MEFGGEGVCTHCGDGAPQSTHLLFSFVLEIVRSLERVSGSTSHILEVMLAVLIGKLEGGVGCENGGFAAIVAFSGYIEVQYG